MATLIKIVLKIYKKNTLQVYFGKNLLLLHFISFDIKIQAFYVVFIRISDKSSAEQAIIITNSYGDPVSSSGILSNFNIKHFVDFENIVKIYLMKQPILKFDILQ